MTQMRSPRQRPATGAPGVKMLITAGALAMTMYGWVQLTSTDRALASSASPAIASGPSTVLALDLPPIPTLAPPPAQAGPVIANSQPGASLAPSAPLLRSVSAPVTITRSSH